jgi:hypothetical protein
MKYAITTLVNSDGAPLSEPQVLDYGIGTLTQAIERRDEIVNTGQPCALRRIDDSVVPSVIEDQMPDGSWIPAGESDAIIVLALATPTCPSGVNGSDISLRP